MINVYGASASYTALKMQKSPFLPPDLYAASNCMLHDKYGYMMKA